MPPGPKKPDEEKLLDSDGASLWGGMSVSDEGGGGGGRGRGGGRGGRGGQVRKTLTFGWNSTKGNAVSNYSEAGGFREHGHRWAYLKYVPGNPGCGEAKRVGAQVTFLVATMDNRLDVRF